MATVELQGVRKVYAKSREPAVPGIDLTIRDGELMVLVGPSGCGKTTVLRMVAGLEDITSGTVSIDGRVVNDLDPSGRDIAMVFQNYALYPHMTVRNNIGFALRLRKLPKSEIRRQVEEAAEILGLTDWLERKPAQLSGGQRQRVAMGRAIVRSPSVFLMDEPLSNLDAKLRVQMRSEVMAVQRRVGVSAIYVTHDQVEAMTMGDRVAVMNRGLLQQVDSAQVLYDRPVNLFVAAFIGSPAMNLFEATIDAAFTTMSLGAARLAIPEELERSHPALRRRAGAKVVLGVRPEDLHVMADADADADADGLSVRVTLIEALGNEQQLHFETDAPRVVAEGAGGEDLGLGGVGVARVPPRLRVAAGDRIALRPDVANLHFFDPETGEAIRA